MSRSTAHGTRPAKRSTPCGSSTAVLGITVFSLTRIADLRGVYLAFHSGYTQSVTKRLVDIDDDLLARARAVAGADTIRATVETALRHLVDQDTVLRHVHRMREPDALDLDHLDAARRPRTGSRG